MTAVMHDLPKSIDGPQAWVAADMEDMSKWLTSWSDDEVAELRNAAEAYLALGRDVGEITADAFPLPTIGARLEKLAVKLLTGNGVEAVRGLPVRELTLEEAATIFCGVGAHMGSARSQNAAGHILGHVRDVGADANSPNTRIYQTSQRQTFHTDSADVVGLLCLNDAKEGGDSLLVSAVSIYNRMMAERPDLAELLFDPIATDRRGEVPNDMDPWMNIPVLSWHEGHLTVFYQRQYIDAAQRFEGAFRLTDAHVEALDMFDALANDPELHIQMRLKPGDMQFVYNHAQLHDRTGFIDWPEPEKRRHLMRLWLSMPGDRPLPTVFKERYGSIEIGNRGGIITENTKLHAPLSI